MSNTAPAPILTKFVSPNTMKRLCCSSTCTDLRHQPLDVLFMPRLASSPTRQHIGVCLSLAPL